MNQAVHLPAQVFFFFFSLFPEHSLCLASFVYVRQTRQLERRLHGHVQVLCS